MSSLLKVEQISPLNLAAFIPYACGQLEAPFVVHVNSITQDEYSNWTDDATKKAKTKSAMTSRSSMIKGEPSQSEAIGSGAGAGRRAFECDTAVRLALTADRGGRALALRLHAPPPRLLLKIIQLCLPFHRALQRLEARLAPLATGLAREIGLLLERSHITELCLDDSRPAPADLPALLECPRLRRAALARCALGDAGCEPLAALLTAPRCALAALALPSNGIGDAGATALARALRSNRSLRHLDLAGNRLADAGAAEILDVLAEFPLTGDELAASRRRLLVHLKARNDAYERCRRELALEEVGRVTRAKGARRTRGRSAAVTETELESPSVRALLAAEELVGPLADPFAADATFVRDGHVYSSGNRALCWLNLSYNELRLPSVLKLGRVLAAQVEGAGEGLVRVLLEGNPLPDGSCAELRCVRELLDGALARRLGGAKRTRDKKNSALPFL